MSPAVGLMALQGAIAELLYDRASRGAFEAAPAAWLAKRGLAEEHARILRALDPQRLRRFHEIQARDRAYFVRALFPLTLAFHRDDILLESYLDQEPFGHDDFAVEAARFADFVERVSGSTTRGRALADLAAYEASSIQLRLGSPESRGTLQRQAPHALAPTVRLLRVRTALPALVESQVAGIEAEAQPKDGWVVLRRMDGGEVVSAEVDASVGALLWDLESGVEPAVAARRHGPGGVAILDELIAEGVIVPALPPEAASIAR